MRKNVYLTAFTFLTLSLCSTVKSKAQNNGSWQPLWLSTSNNFKGIEGYYQVSTCNGSDVVLIKLVNQNNYAVRAGWKDNAIDKNSKFIPSNAIQDSLTLAPNSETVGSCAGNTQNLVVKISSFGITAADFHGLWATNFDYIIVH
jgi:hypothetical protein